MWRSSQGRDSKNFEKIGINVKSGTFPTQIILDQHCLNSLFPRPPSVYCIDADSPTSEVMENFNVQTGASDENSESAGPRLKRKFSKFVRRTFSHDDDDEEDEQKTEPNGNNSLTYSYIASSDSMSIIF